MVDVDDNADVDRLFGLASSASDDDTSASSFPSTLSSSPTPGSKHAEHQLETSPPADHFDVHLEQTKAYNRKRRREEVADTSAAQAIATRERASQPPQASSPHMHPFFTSKPAQSNDALVGSLSSSLVPSPPPLPTFTPAPSSKRLLSDEQMLKVLTPTPYYTRHGVQDYDQVMSADRTQVSAYEDLTKIAESDDYIRVPSFALGDGGVHGPQISDHSMHKSRHDGYWEERLRKLDAQQPVAAYYSNLSAFATDPSADRPSACTSTTGSTSDAVYPPIFAGCLMYIDGRTEGASQLSAHSLAALIRLHGGHTSPLVSRTHTTHIIATNLTLSKHMKEMRQTLGMARGRGKVVVVKPEWVRECIRQGKLLEERHWRVVKDLKQRELSWTAAGDDEADSKTPAEE